MHMLNWTLARRWAGFTTVVAAAFVAGNPSALAQTNGAASSTDNVSSEADAELQALLDIPDGTAEQLIEHLTELVRATPGDRTPAEARAFLRQTSKALVAGADKLLALEPDAKQASLAYQVKILALQRLVRFSEPKAAEQLEALVAGLRRDPREQVAVVGWQTFLTPYFQAWQNLSDEDKQAFVDEILAEVKRATLKPLHVELVQVVAQQIEMRDPDLTKDLVNRALQLFKTSNDGQIQEAAERMAGMARRLSLPGNKMELSGTLLDGGEFDWDSYRGKVVLVDFWATWCPPCIAELPNVLAMYEAYHDRGFDVVGVSLDESKEQVESFIEENGVPWATLFPSDPEQREWRHPIADYYGISAIPTAILVDQKGQVVEMTARDAVLRTKLKELLGDPDAPLPNDASSDSSTR